MSNKKLLTADKHKEKNTKKYLLKLRDFSKELENR